MCGTGIEEMMEQPCPPKKTPTVASAEGAGCAEILVRAAAHLCETKLRSLLLGLQTVIRRRQLQKRNFITPKNL